MIPKCILIRQRCLVEIKARLCHVRGSLFVRLLRNRRVIMQHESSFINESFFHHLCLFQKSIERTLKNFSSVSICNETSKQILRGISFS